MKNSIIIFYFFLGALSAEFNSFGNLGYINTSSAYNLPEGHYLFNVSRNNPDRRISLTASPFNWLDATVFYVDIVGKNYPDYNQSYKDKGFSVKFSPITIFDHDFAIGLNDFAGTGLFSSEYIVLSNTTDNFEYSFGIGWGSFSNGIEVSNPLIRIDESFAQRPGGFVDRGGNFDINKYFSGGRASIFFGGAYKLNKNTSLIFERDPTDTLDRRVPYSKKKTNYSFGVNYKYGNFSVKTSLQRGTNFGIQVSYSKDATKFNPISQIETSQKIKTFADLQNHLALLDIGLKSVSASEDSIQISVRQVSYFDQSDVDRKVTESVKDINLKQQFKEVVIKQYYQGMNVSSTTLDANYIYPVKSRKFKKDRDLYIVKDQFPYFSSKIFPVIKNFIAGREGFYFGGLQLNGDLEVTLRENVLMLVNLKYNIWDNFSNLIYPPVDTYPAQVRSDIKKYFKGSSNGISIGRLELNYFHSPKKNHYIRTVAGMFEDMFGGYGVDYVFSPQDSIFSFGLEAYHVKKRDYDMAFDFQSYANNLVRGSVQILEPKTNVRFKISFGEYLAGDKGYTVEAKKSFKNGAKFGVFFSRTNVPKNLFGEGSFDKGIVFSIPLPNLLTRETAMGKYIWRPLTKDPAATLVKSIDLQDELERYRFY